MPKVQILDYGSGNLFSIRNTIEKASPKINVSVSSTYKPSRVDALILPGVGSFTSAQEILNRNRESMLADLRKSRITLLGICLGMQLLFEESEEGPGQGLGIFKGKVKRFRASSTPKIPHTGWNTIEVARRKITSPSEFCRGVPDSAWVYYVHSFFPVPEDERIVRAWTEYGNQRFPAIIEKGRVLGTQFHPEKSGITGFKLISNFIRLMVVPEKKR